jgi:hypothetical protein
LRNWNRHRGLYTGCVGFIAPERSVQLNVAIRTAVVDRSAGNAEYGSGGGIVWDSASDDEYTEALLKARVLTEQRSEFSLLETMLWTPEGFSLDYHIDALPTPLPFGYPVTPGKYGLLWRRVRVCRGPQRAAAGLRNGSVSEVPTLLTPGSRCPARAEPHAADVFLSRDNAAVGL